MEFYKLIESRYSVRAYEKRPVASDLIHRVLEAARVAPTAVNKQPWHILVVRGEEAMGRLAKCTTYTFGAPAALIVGYYPAKSWVRPYDNDNSGQVDAAIVATHVMLAIHDLGLGACWVGYFDPKAVLEHFRVDFTPVAIFPFGYPAADSRPSQRHGERLPLEATVSYDGDF